MTLRFKDNISAHFKMFTEKVIQFNNISSRIVFLEKKGNSNLSKIEKEEYTELKKKRNKWKIKKRHSVSVFFRIIFPVLLFPTLF